MTAAVAKYEVCNKQLLLHPNYARRVGQNASKVLKALDSDGVSGAQIISLGNRRRGNNNSNEGGAPRNGNGYSDSGGLLLRVAEPEHMQKLLDAIAAQVGTYALQSTPQSPNAEVKVAKGYIGVVIGKGGSELSRVESEYGVVVDVVKSRSVAILVGETEEAVAGTDSHHKLCVCIHWRPSSQFSLTDAFRCSQ